MSVLRDPDSAWRLDHFTRCSFLPVSRKKNKPNNNNNNKKPRSNLCNRASDIIGRYDNPIMIFTAWTHFVPTLDYLLMQVNKK